MVEIDIPIDEETQVNHSTPEYFYSENLQRYIQRQPLSLDNEIVAQAERIGIQLSWDDAGRINNIDFPMARKLADALGMKLLSPTEFWEVYADAKQVNDPMIDSLKDDDYAEWLDAVFRKDDSGNVFMIEHPEISYEDTGEIHYSGEEKQIRIPEGRPGWFRPDGNINSETGFPIHVDTHRTKGTPEWSKETWKYWSVFKVNEYIVPIRGTVTSSATPSFDTDMPSNVRTDKLLFRPTYDQLPNPEIDLLILRQAEVLCHKYSNTTAQQAAEIKVTEHENFYETKQQLFSFLNEHGSLFAKTQDKKGLIIKENLIDMLGIVRIMAESKKDAETIRIIDGLAHKIFEIQESQVRYDDFYTFIVSSKDRLSRGLNEKKRIVFVMGHKNPDTDTAISSMFEAYRNSLMDLSSVYIPLIQDARIPDEVKKLIGDDLSSNLLRFNDEIFQKAIDSGLVRYILVDHNVDPVQRFALSIVDHHILSDKAKNMEKPLSWEMVGSCTAQIAQKLSGIGVTLDQKLARIIYGATLMDTENRSVRKMTYKDHMIMDDLKIISGVTDGDRFFQELMSELLNTDYAELLFNRDYKADWGVFGFAVAKVKEMFGHEGEIVKTKLLDVLKKLAIENNQNNNFPLTIVKVVDYLEDNSTVNREKILLIFNKYVMPEFKQTMFTLLEHIINHEFENRAQIKLSEDAIDFYGVGDQLSRKVTAPSIEPIVRAYNQYFRSEEIQMYIKRSFLQADPVVLEKAKNLDINIHTDSDGNVVGITYYEAKKLLEALGLSMLSLSEYWQARKEAIGIKDSQMADHLRTLAITEMLDTVIVGKDKIIHHPKIVSDTEITGEIIEFSIPVALPGLIHPDDIDPISGFPINIHPPSEFGDKSLLRYWSTARYPALSVRGVIRLYGQLALDTKIFPDDALMKMTVRPCTQFVIPPKVNFTVGVNGVHVEIIFDGKKEEYDLITRKNGD